MNGKTRKIVLQLIPLKDNDITGYFIEDGNLITIELSKETFDKFERDVKQQRDTDVLDAIGDTIFSLIKNGLPDSSEEIEAQIFHRIPTPNGPVIHGTQFDFGTHQSNIVCVLCMDNGKSHCSKTLKQHARHVLKEHPEIFRSKSAERKAMTA